MTAGRRLGDPSWSSGLPRTRWRIVAIDGKPLKVELAMDTAAPFVVRALEAACRGMGITLERVRER